MIKYMDEIALKGRRVLMRVDFNVPFDDSGDITDDNRIRAALPDIRFALESGARLILCSHLGSPKGERIEKYSLRPAAKRLGELLGRDVPLVPDCIGADVEKAVNGLKDGDILLLENLRFHAGETKNDPDFAKALASLADVYINDAFSVSHRAHASVDGVTRFVKSCAAGFLLKKELAYFKKALEDPVRPLVAILGGAKVSSKLGAIKNIIEKVDKLIIGGAMANTFLLALGFKIGSSLIEASLVKAAGEIVQHAREKDVKLYLPVDFVIAEEMKKDAVTKIVTAQEIPSGWMALDIGPASVRLFREAIDDARTIIWNGPMGAFEFDSFSMGTLALARAVGEGHALSIVGGGDTDAAIHKAKEEGNISYMSTGGGAFLELLEGKKLPGILALEGCQSNEPS
ncbi:MAG: phosphoglycerate kinase [Dissulfurimicrobium sp.]|uniref:phosphoglycerate kinase n=1 Tax=Dissulfurimicrobium sp. TaxID=2022436 RepID=UPI004049B8C4